MSLSKIQMKGKALPTIAPNLREAMMTADLVPRLSLTLYTSLSPSCQEHLVPCLFLTLHSCIEVSVFYIYSCLNISTWVMCQHCMALDQQLPSLIALLMFTFDCLSTKDRIMFCLFWDMTEHFQIGVDCLKSSTRHRAISSNYPVLQFSLAHCFSYGMHLRDSSFHETTLVPITFSFPLVIRLLSFSFLEYYFLHSSAELLVFLCLIWSVFQEHHKELKCCASSIYLHFAFIHSFIHLSINL